MLSLNNDASNLGTENCVLSESVAAS